MGADFVSVCVRPFSLFALTGLRWRFRLPSALGHLFEDRNEVFRTREDKDIRILGVAILGKAFYGFARDGGQ